jgi:uncharacterized membrane protein YphA (DoxX/SURF4 family)
MASTIPPDGAGRSDAAVDAAVSVDREPIERSSIERSSIERGALERAHSPDSGRRRAVAVVRIVFGLIWAVDAALKWLPTFAQSSFIGTLQGARLGQPDVIAAWINIWLNVLQSDPSLFAHVLAVVESLLAVCLLVGAFTNLACLVGGRLTLGLWTTAEGFGGPYVAGGTDIGAGLIYVLVFAVLAISAAGSSWGLDAWLRPRLGRLRWLCSPVGRSADLAR